MYTVGREGGNLMGRTQLGVRVRGLRGKSEGEDVDVRFMCSQASHITLSGWHPFYVFLSLSCECVPLAKCGTQGIGQVVGIGVA